MWECDEENVLILGKPVLMHRSGDVYLFTACTSIYQANKQTHTSNNKNNSNEKHRDVLHNLVPLETLIRPLQFLHKSSAVLQVCSVMRMCHTLIVVSIMWFICSLFTGWKRVLLLNIEEKLKQTLKH